MRCHTHRDVDAVGVCRSCGKGVCGDCAADLGRGLACAGRCEEDVRRLVELADRSAQQLERSQALVGNAASLYRSLAWFLVVVGLVFLGWSFTLEAAAGFVRVVGVVLLLFGLVVRWAAGRMAEAAPQTGA